VLLVLRSTDVSICCLVHSKELKGEEITNVATCTGFGFVESWADWESSDTKKHFETAKKKKVETRKRKIQGSPRGTLSSAAAIALAVLSIFLSEKVLMR